MTEISDSSEKIDAAKDRGKRVKKNTILFWFSCQSKPIEVYGKSRKENKEIMMKWSWGYCFMRLVFLRYCIGSGRMGEEDGIDKGMGGEWKDQSREQVKYRIFLYCWVFSYLFLYPWIFVFVSKILMYF